MKVWGEPITPRFLVLVLFNLLKYCPYYLLLGPLKTCLFLFWGLF